MLALTRTSVREPVAKCAGLWQLITQPLSEVELQKLIMKYIVFKMKMINTKIHLFLITTFYYDLSS